MMRRGFTITELIIVITIIGILLTLAVVNLNNTQAKARDDERRADVEAIAQHLETFYTSGLSGSTLLQRYPTTNLVSSENTMRSTLQDIDPKSLTAPGVSAPTGTFIAATNSNESPGGIAPQPTVDQYVYQPIATNGSLCTGTLGTEPCRKFNIFYRLEADNTVYKYESKNR